MFRNKKKIREILPPVILSSITRLAASNENLQNGHSIQRESFRETRVSMDLTSPGTLSFHNIRYTISEGIIRKHKKEIINGVSGIFKSGMNAIMGATGSGKSSLLDILADRKDPDGLSGQVLIDGHPPPSSYKYIVGYVVQEDIINGILTVRENLVFSANLRLTNDVSKKERQERVTNIIQELGLESCADTRLGTEFLRGVSGGERKRTCIGMELVLSPKILFLDEPTTGLDASTAQTVMIYLKELSRRGRTIIFSIHQPRYSIFKLFDHVILMCKGKNIYQDSSSAMLSYFNAQGYECEEHDNPADFVLDVLINASRKPEDLEKLNKAYVESQKHTNINSQLTMQLHDDQLERLRRKQRGAAARSFCTELYYVSQRTLRNGVRNPELFLAQTTVAVVIGVFVGLVFYNIQKTVTPGIQNRLGAIFFIVICQVFSTLTALDPFIKERALFIHENVSGYYRISTFFLGKIICDILPMRIIPSIIFSLIVYFMMGLERTAGQFLIFLVTTFMSSLFGSAVCFFISATISIFPVALIITVLIIVVMSLFGGFIISLDSMFVWISWIQWISAFRYAGNVLAINEFRNNTYCLANFTYICPVTGADVLAQLDLHYTTSWDIWKYFFALTMMAITFLVLAFIQLHRIKKTK